MSVKVTTSEETYAPNVQHIGGILPYRYQLAFAQKCLPIVSEVSKGATLLGAWK